MAFNLNATPIVTEYQERIDWLINNMGKNIVLHIKQDPVESDPVDDIEDPIRGPVVKKPFYKPNGQIEIYDTVTIKALLKNNPQDFKRFNIQVADSENILRVKTFMSNYTNLIRCEHMTLEDKNLNYFKFKLLREPMNHGLRDDRYCIAFFERVI